MDVRPGFIVCDDVLDDGPISSPAKRTELLEWYEEFKRSR